MKDQIEELTKQLADKDEEIARQRQEMEPAPNQAKVPQDDAARCEKYKSQYQNCKKRMKSMEAAKDKEIAELQDELKKLLRKGDEVSQLQKENQMHIIKCQELND